MTVVLEGTAAEVRQQLEQLPPGTPVRLLLEQSDVPDKDKPIEMEELVYENRILMLPRRPTEAPVTQELIARIREEEGI